LQISVEGVGKSRECNVGKQYCDLRNHVEEGEEREGERRNRTVSRQSRIVTVSVSVSPSIPIPDLQTPSSF
jgi:hypothetical protein